VSYPLAGVETDVDGAFEEDKVALWELKISRTVVALSMADK